MPETNFDGLDEDRRRMAREYVPGYDWIPGRFGPPPGIPKARKEQFDRMSDREYLYAFLRMSQDEKECLMVSEAERRRTFAAHWPIETIVKANDCAKEGFYYTGVADRVQCVFCGGIIRNWERGDVPKLQHRNFFSYCKFVLHQPCQNIPISPLSDMLRSSLSAAVEAPDHTGNLNISTSRPKNPTLSILARRKATYRRYPESNPVEADLLCNAGFIYEGIGDKVKCFWCDGALEMWSRGDDPWKEHAKWYPGCTYVQQTKGLDFIKEARSRMTADEIATAETLIYNNGDVSFLDEVAVVVPLPPPVDQLEGYTLCLSLGYKPELIKRAYQANMNEEFDNGATLISIVQDLDEEVTTSLEECRKNAEQRKLEKAANSLRNSSARPQRQVNVNELITNTDDPTEQDSKDLIEAISCKMCQTNMAGAVLLPCGCFCLCQNCTRGNLPQKCPACSSIVRGACRTFLS